MSSKGIIAVVGTGTMGRGIAQLAAGAGFKVHLFDGDATQVDQAMSHIERSTARRVEKGKCSEEERRSLLGNLESYSLLNQACAGAELVLEAIAEDLDVKVGVLAQARESALPDAVLASNTSSLSITELGARLRSGKRTVGMHFFNPPTVMQLLEIVRGLHTTPETVERARRYAGAFGKTAIVVVDSPGFATSRLGLVIGAEAMRMLETGVASVADIDRAMELGYRHPMGPLKLSDLVGLDVRLAILEHLHREIGEQFRPPAILRQMVRAGWLGKKTGRGFYRWTDDGPVEVL